MNLANLILTAQQEGASDLHLEPSLPAALRIRGAIKTFGGPLNAQFLAASAQEIVGTEHWPAFLDRRSYDGSRTIKGVRCRINVLQTARGVGFAIRLLSGFQATLEKLNLHPDLKRFTTSSHGLVLVTGRTGCGKSSTLAALIQEINLGAARHVVTLESPIEYTFKPRYTYIRQREVGRDTPSFEQGLLDALREDPDVLMVGEMREPETMRLTLNAAETGHLVLATVHAGNCTEALQRILLAFSPEIQNNICAQLADCLIGVVAQHLVYRSDLGYRVPECEVLTTTTAVKSHIRNQDFFKIASAIETGANAGMWSYDRYRSWLEKKTNWFNPTQATELTDPESLPEEISSTSAPTRQPSSRATRKTSAPKGTPSATSASGSPIEIEPLEGGLNELLKDME
jgi:twitching motility protein PilT